MPSSCSSVLPPPDGLWRGEKGEQVGPVQGPVRWASEFGGNRRLWGSRTPPGSGSLAHAAALRTGSETPAAVAKSLQLSLLCFGQPLHGPVCRDFAIPVPPFFTALKIV